MSKNYSEKPRLADKDYLTKYDKDCIEDEASCSAKRIFVGKGVYPAAHPLREKINFTRTKCSNCNSFNVKVIYAHWCVHMMSGDTYWDYEIHCETCNMFTKHSFADND